MLLLLSPVLALSHHSVGAFFDQGNFSELEGTIMRILWRNPHTAFLYLAVPFVTTSHFKKEPDGSKWMPTPCETPPPTRDRPMTNGFEDR